MSKSFESSIHTAGDEPKQACHARMALAMAVLMALTQVAMALPDDRDQPIFIQSDRAERDERKGTTVYTGDVEIDQGSLHISADRVTIHDSAEHVSAILASGKPARMHQKPAPEREPVYARALTIRYDVDKEVLTLLDQASVTQEGTTVTGDRIDYFIQEQRVKAVGGGTATGQDRVKVVIPPRRAAGVPAPAAPSTGPESR